MSSMQFGDGTTFGAAEAAAAPVEPQPVEPLQPIPPLNQVSAPPQVAAPVPAEAVPAVPVTDMRDVPLGTLVFRAGLLPEERLEEALQEGMKTGRRLGEILLERGWVSENDLGRLLAGQKGLPFVELDPAAIDLTAPPLLHPEKARLHGALPIGFQDGVPIVAVADPSNDLVVENVRRALACEPLLVVAGRDALARTIEQVYSGGVDVFVSPEPAPASEVVHETPAIEAAATPVVEPVLPAESVEPAVEPVLPVAESVEPVVEPVQPVVEPIEPAAVPAMPVPEPVAAVEPLAPPAAEPVVPAEPVAPVVEPVPAQSDENGHGLWLGETVAESLPQPVQPVGAAQPVSPEASPAQPVEPVQPVVENVLAHPEPEPEPEPQLSWTVVLRLSDGERIEVGSFVGETEATEGARSTVAQIATDGSWPFFAGRFLRPDTIVSVDLVQDDADRWLGSSARAAVWTQKPTG